MNLDGWTLTFNENFDTLNRFDGENGRWKTWFYFGDRSLPSNGELQYYLDPEFQGTAGQPLGVNPFSIENGVLTITAQPTDPAVRPHIWDYAYTSGLITTEPSFSQQYGYFEIRAQMPEGKGLWPAFWLLPDSKTWPPEIDILESHGDRPTQIHIATHTEFGNSGGWKDLPADVTEGFHTYGVDWQADRITWYFDGVEIGSTETPGDMHQPMYMLANLAVGGNWPGAPDETTSFPAEMDIDYIRAYSRAPGATPADDSATPVATGSPSPQVTPTAVAEHVPTTTKPLQDAVQKASTSVADIAPQPTELMVTESLSAHQLQLVQAQSDVFGNILAYALAREEMPAWLADVASDARQQGGDWW